MKRDGVSYSLHHIGIPTDVVREGERYAVSVGMWTSDDLTGPLPVQWHRFTENSPCTRYCEPCRTSLTGSAICNRRWLDTQ